MYQIVGVQRSHARTLLASPGSACEALTQYRAAQMLFARVIVVTPDGEEIDGFELNRRADAERKVDQNA